MNRDTLLSPEIVFQLRRILLNSRTNNQGSITEHTPCAKFGRCLIITSIRELPLSRSFWRASQNLNLRMPEAPQKSTLNC